jgi:hypothetical protein
MAAVTRLVGSAAWLVKLQWIGRIGEGSGRVGIRSVSKGPAGR